MEKNSIRKILHRLDLERRQLMRPKFLELGLTVGEGQPRILDCLLDRGELTPERAKNYPGRNLITRAIGTESVVNCDVFHKKLNRGDWLLLCTDGLSNQMDDQEILFEVVHGQDRQKCCQRLLEIAKGRGAPDNVTSILVAI